MTTFKIFTFDAGHEAFSYDYSPRRPLAAGMRAKLTVTFKCTSMEDLYQLIAIVTKDNRVTHVLIRAENPIPLLKCKYMLHKYVQFTHFSK